MAYTKDNPKWIQAKSVKRAIGKNCVDVIVYDEAFENCQISWRDRLLNKSKSDVLVQNSRGDWLRVWFYDEDVSP